MSIIRRYGASIFLCVLLSGMPVLSAGAQESGAARKIAEIIIKNNRIVSEQTIRTHLQSKIGADFSQSIVSDDIKRLYATGYFRDVSAGVEDLPNSTVRLIFTVEEKPVLGTIEFVGNRKIKTRHLRKKMQIKSGEIFDQFKLKEDVETIRKFYAEKGFAQVELETATKNADDGTIQVTLTVREGPRLRVRRIDFDGNASIARKRLLKLIQTKRRKFFSSGFLKEEVLSEDAERILVFYRQEGFLDAAVSTQIEQDPRKSWLVVRFSIVEGKQYHVGKSAFSGNYIFSLDKIKSLISLTSGAVYSEQRLRSDISQLQSAYFDEGYIAATVKVDTLLNSESGDVDVSYDIREGHIAYVDDINIRGNDRTRDVVIRREIRLHPADRYNGEKLRRSRQRLYNLGYFEEVTFETAKEPTTLPDKYDLDLFVKESKTGEFSFGAGYSSVDKFIGFIDLTQRNFDIFNWDNFTGGGQQMSARVEFGSERREYDLTFVEPWFLGYPLSVGSNIYNRLREWETYTEKRIGGTIFFGKEISEFWKAKLTYRNEGVRISDLADDASIDIRQEEGKNYIHSTSWQLTHDSRDNIFNPSRGIYNLYSIDVAGGALGGDRNFVKHYTQNSKYFPLTDWSVLELRMRAGMVETYQDSGSVPIYERFYVGGANTIRGYKERRVGPKGENGDPTGGRIMVVANAEYSFKLAENLKWAFFYDIGNAWERHSLLDFEGLKLKAGVGTGARVKTPLGPIRIDYGYALQPETGDSHGRLHFTMGQEF